MVMHDGDGAVQTGIFHGSNHLARAAGARFGILNKGPLVDTKLYLFLPPRDILHVERSFDL